MTRSIARIAALGTLVLAPLACSANGTASKAGAGDPGGAGGAGGDGGASGEGGSSAGGTGGGLGFDASFDGGTTDPDAGCLTTTSKSNALPANLMFQLDLSGSMNCLPTEDANVSSSCANAPQAGSRWNILRDALIQSLVNIPPDNAAGIMHFPLYPPLPSCVPTIPDVPLAPLSSNTVPITNALNALTPQGGTPTHDAAVAAYLALKASSSQGNKYIVLATDGQANYCVGCNPLCDINADSQQFISEVASAAQNDGIRTFVIGVPGSDAFRAVLSRLAEAGGTAQAGCQSGDIVTSPTVGNCHYDMTTSASNFGQAIADALAAISGQALSCSYSIPPQDAGSFDPGKVNVQFSDGTTTGDIPRDKTKTDGWDYSPDGTHVELYGPACDKVKAAKNGEVDIVYGCPTKNAS